VRAPLLLDVLLDASLDEVRGRLGGWESGLVAEGRDRCVWPLSGDSVAQLVSALAWVPEDIPFELRGDQALLTLVAAASSRPAAAVRAREASRTAMDARPGRP
jgi:hypothetical protein